MVSAVVGVLALLFLEWLYWLSPWQTVFFRWTERLAQYNDVGYSLFPYHYLLRMIVLTGALLLWPHRYVNPFGGGLAWVYSLLSGVILGFVSVIMLIRMSSDSLSAFLRAVYLWEQSNPNQFWIRLLYILVYPALCEELLFRWFLVVTLSPSIGIWVLFIAPLINIIWHLPVWIYTTSGVKTHRVVTILNTSVPAFVLSIVLTVLYIGTGNLVGPVMIHAVGDWTGEVVRYMKDDQAHDKAGQNVLSSK